MAQYNVHLLSRANGGNCETTIKVVDERPSFCGPYPYILYPVIVEDFNFKEELPNNWSFSQGNMFGIIKWPI